MKQRTAKNGETLAALLLHITHLQRPNSVISKERFLLIKWIAVMLNACNIFRLKSMRSSIAHNNHWTWSVTLMGLYSKGQLTMHVWMMKAISSELFKCLHTDTACFNIDTCHLFPAHHTRMKSIYHIGRYELVYSVFYLLQIKLEFPIVSISIVDIIVCAWYGTISNTARLRKLWTMISGPFY